MQTMTKALARLDEIGDGIGAIFNKKKAELRKAANKKRDDAIIKLFRYALNMRAVQQIIADIVSGPTPLCGVLDEAISNHRFEVHAEDVEGLDKYIEHEMEELFRNYEPEADDIKGLDRWIESYIEENSEGIVDNVVDEIGNRMRNK